MRLSHHAGLVLAALMWTAGAVSAPAIDVQGHRGARGLVPENTLAGFRRAVAEGVSTLELDVGVTRDGVAVIHHDDALNAALARDRSGRWIDVPRLIAGLSHRELGEFDVGRLRPESAYAARHPAQVARDGETVPSLASLFAMLDSLDARRSRFNIETKLSPLTPERTASPQAMVEAILKVVDLHRMRERVSLQSFDWRTLALLRAQAPDIPRIHLTVRRPWLDNVDPRWNAGLKLEHHGSVPRLVKAAGGDAWSPFHGDLTAAEMEESRTLGLKVIVWTVNSPADIERMLNLGVDGLITDYPDLARRLIEGRGRTIAPISLDSRAAAPGAARASAVVQ
jgi:glycerophosphoryl diester phosphodiesterase